METNKYFSVLGDSISTLAGYHPPECEAFYQSDVCYYTSVFRFMDTWWGQVIDRFGGMLLVNHSWAGSTVCKLPAFEIPSYACSDERTGALAREGILPDVILVYMGTNDRGYGLRVTSEDTADLSVFSNAYTAMLKKLKKNYPQAEIWCCTLYATGSWALYGGTREDAYSQAIRLCAKREGCYLAELAGRLSPTDLPDGIHPNAHGMRCIADAVIHAMESRENA